MSAPYYEDGTVTLYHGDCLALIRSLPKIGLVDWETPDRRAVGESRPYRLPGH